MVNVSSERQSTMSSRKECNMYIKASHLFCNFGSNYFCNARIRNNRLKCRSITALFTYCVNEKILPPA